MVNSVPYSFPLKSIAVVSITFSKELENLRQGDNSLTTYYQRTIQIVQRFGARNRLSKESPLSILESSMLNLVFSAFLKGLSDPSLRMKAIPSPNLKSSFPHEFRRVRTISTIQYIQQSPPMFNPFRQFSNYSMLSVSSATSKFARQH